MLELRESYRALVESAPSPPARDWLQRRAGELRRRRHRLQASALTAIVVCLGVAAGTAWSHQAAPQRVRVVHQPVEGDTSTTIGLASRTQSPAGLPPAPTPGQTAAARSPGSAAPRAGAPSPNNAPQHAAYPPASGCSVDATGLATGASRSCRFTATKAGGWWAGDPQTRPGSQLGGVSFKDSVVEVWVTRGSSTTPYDTYGTPGYGCGDAIIEPGDLVEVDLKLGSGVSASSGGRYEGGAGFGWSCRGPGG